MTVFSSKYPYICPKYYLFAQNIGVFVLNKFFLSPIKTVFSQNIFFSHVPLPTGFAKNMTGFAPNTSVLPPTITIFAPNVNVLYQNMTVFSPNTNAFAPNITVFSPNTTAAVLATLSFSGDSPGWQASVKTIICILSFRYPCSLWSMVLPPLTHLTPSWPP